MRKLAFYGLRVTYLLFLLCIPDYTACTDPYISTSENTQPDAKIAKAYHRAFPHRESHENMEDASSEKELKGELMRLARILASKRKEKKILQQRINQVENVQNAATEHVTISDTQVERSSRSWAVALKIISGGAQAACVATIIANIGCGGLQKNICVLRKEVAQLREDLASETKVVMSMEDRYEDLRDIATKADSQNEKIIARLEDSVDISQKYLKLLAKVKEYVTNLPVVLPSFFQLDTKINKFIIDLDNIPSSASSQSEAIVWGATLGLELLPYMGAYLKKGYYKLTGKKPNTAQVDGLVKSGKSTYALKGNELWAVDKLNKPVKQASISKLQPKSTQLVGVQKPAKTSTWQKFTGKMSKLANSAIGKCMTYVFQVAAIALCGWQLYEIIKNNHKAESDLTAQRQNMTNFLNEVHTSKANMQNVIDQVHTQVNNHVKNFMTLNDLLLDSRTFHQVANAKERQSLIDMKKAKTTDSTLLSNQKVMYSFLLKYYTDLKNAYDFLRKSDQIALDVVTDSSVENILKKLQNLNIPVAGKLEIYSIIAKLYPDKIRYDGIVLACIKDGRIKTESQLNDELKKRVIPQNVISQLTIMALATTPVNMMKMVLKGRFKITLSADEILGVISKSQDFMKQDFYKDYMGVKHDLKKYRQGLCS